jgi:signal transduction histidine kinase
VKRALICLADNAIKYSYIGQRRNSSELYKVRVKVMIEGSHVKITFINYGIGFPREKFERIRDYSIRGQVQDAMKDQPGFGLGLPYAIEVFEKLGGWIEVTSVPSKSVSEDEKQNYLRYITTVEAALPILPRG